MDSENYAEQYLDMLIRSRKQIAESWMQKPINGEEYIIEYLSEHPGPIYPSELSIQMQTSTARIAAILKHLYNLELILRDEDEFDARKHPVELSKAGIKRAKEIHKNRLKIVSEVFDKIGEEETESFIKITNHIIEVCKEMEYLSEKLPDKKEGFA